MKSSTIALVICYESGDPHLLDTFYDSHEIGYLECAIREGEKDPLSQIYELRERQALEDSAFGDYVEELLSKPFLSREIQSHGIQWLKSKIKMEQTEKTEQEAIQTIADYAYKIFEQDRKKIDFFLANSTSQVRIRIFTLDSKLSTKAMLG